mgnify:CR=1 FL=1
MTGKKRNREEKEKMIYNKLNVPYKDDTEEDNLISYFLSQIQPEYEEALQYYFSFEGITDEIFVYCLWGHLPLIDGAIANFTQKIEIDKVANYVNFRKKEKVFNFFANIQCLLNVDADTLRKLTFFENGKYGFICKGQKDYFLLMNIKSLDKFDFITKNSEYCQFWLIRIEDKDILDILKLESMNKTIVMLSKQIDEYKSIIKERDELFQKERKEFNERINKILDQRDQQYKKLKGEYDELKKEKNDIIEQRKNENKHKLIKIKKFLGLKVYRDCFSIIEENNVISYEDLSVNEEDEDSSRTENKNLGTCIICYVRQRNILFERCGHCCICDTCLEQCAHKMNKKTHKKEYFCPVCNTYVSKGEGYSTTRKIFLS